MPETNRPQIPARNVIKDLVDAIKDIEVEDIQVEEGITIGDEKGIRP